MKLYSYVVATDCGFAPNPFYDFCTLATCKPDIRERATVGDWVIGTGSGAKEKQRNGYLVFAMRVTETMSFDEYWKDIRFCNKRPDMHASGKKSCGDNIYHTDPDSNGWSQMDSYHSYDDGTPNQKNVCNDTQVDRVLVSDDFIYWGGTGPKLPMFCGVNFCKSGPSYKYKFHREKAVAGLIAWIRGLNVSGCCGSPLDLDPPPRRCGKGRTGRGCPV